MNFDAHMNELSPSDADAFRNVARRLRAMPEREPSSSLDGRILAAVDAEPACRRIRFRAPAPLWGVAAAAALAAAATWLYVGSGRPASVGDAPADLAWLAARQEADGMWSPAKYGGAEIYRPALTALAALALERAGDPYAAHVRRARAALAASQTVDGAFGGEGRAQLYNHAITTFALATLDSGRTADRPALERALAFIRARQTPEGGWDYEAGSEGNAAVTAWQVRALACAEARGFEGAKVPLRKGLRWLRGRARDDGSIAYHRDSASRSDSLTALAAYALITAGKEFPGLPELGRLAVGSLSAGPERADAADCYRDYAKVLAFESAGAGGKAEAVRVRMLKSRETGARDQWEAAGGSLYTAALTALASK